MRKLLLHIFSIAFLTFILCLAANATIILSVPDSSGKAGDVVVVPINIDNATGVAGGDITLAYDSNMLSVVKAEATPLIASLNPIINTTVAGKVTLAMASITPLAGGSGAILNITFQVSAAAQPCQTSDLVFQRAKLYDKDANDIPTQAINGKFTVGPCVTTITLSVPDSSGKAGDTVIVPINIDNATGVAGGDITLTYDSNMLSVTKAEATALIASLNPVINTTIIGKVILAMASITPLAGGSGAILNITFQVSPTAQQGQTSDLVFQRAKLYDKDANDIPTQAINGKFTVVKPIGCSIPGDVSGNGTVSAYDAALILQFVVGIIDKFPCELMSTPIVTQRPESYKVSIPSLTVAPGNRIRVPIIIDDATGITAGGISVKYDAETLRAVNISTSELLSGYYWMKNINPGEVRIAFAGTIPLHGKGELLYIEFESLLSTGKSQSPIILAEVSFGERVQVIKAHGSVEVLPAKTALLANYPNPFNPDTWIPFLLAEPAEVTITIFSTTGQVVRTVALGHRGAGTYIRKNKAAYWNGKNENGETVGSGVYFYTLNAGKFTATRKMLVIK